MDNMKEMLHESLYFIKKYKVIIISMLLSAVFILCGIKIYTVQQEAKIYGNSAKQIIEMSQNIIKYYQTSPNYWGLSTAMVINKNLYAQNMKTKNGRLIGYFNNPVEVGADENGNAVMPTSKNFVIAYNGLNKKQCIGIGSHKFNKSFWLKVNKIVVKNAQKTQEFIWGDKEYGLPANPRKLKDLCQNSNNSIVIYF